MLQRPANGAKVRASTEILVIYAWYVAGKAAFWWHSQPENVPIATVQVCKNRVNMKTAVKFAMVLAGHTF
jgi:hypothetical protein